jgi:hypothetical protein
METGPVTYGVPPPTQRMSVRTDGGQANRASASPMVSANGRFVAFHSAASNLVDDDTNGKWDVFVYDRIAGSIERVSLSSDGEQANGPSIFPSISGTGRFVAFRSAASNLVPGDTNRKIDAMVYDRATDRIERVSTGARGVQANRDIDTLNLSQDGRLVVFSTIASNLVAGDTNGVLDVYARNRASDRTTRLSISNLARQANNQTHATSVSAGGRYVAFRSFASNLVSRDTNGTADAFVFDRRRNHTTRVNVTTLGVQARGTTFRPTLSGDGRLVVFRSNAANLVSGDTNLHIDVFVHDRATGITRRVNVSSSGRQANARSFRPTISGDGRYVVYSSLATNLVAGDTNRARDVFRYDRRTGRTIRVSVTSRGAQTNACSANPRTNGRGNVVVFTSVGRNLVPQDTNRVSDVFARRLGP